ncbi:MAG TPA: alcohol dehydrogenase catalytic domain-containing protein, partial [Solirubrobacteraceae bacterium]|nr:alcohol dehydrogenase catalytic domain-containing protein [Solirubrobacteraceae bacterium]
MRRLLFIEPGRLEWEEAPDPDLQGRGEAIVRPIVASNCDLDTAIVRGDVPLPGPFAIGHEFVAEVLDVGEEVISFARGDHVIVPWKVSCGTCSACRRGVTAGCTAVPALAMFGLPIGGEWGSGLADKVRVPFAEQMLLALPPSISPAVLASASDNLPDAWRCVAPYLSQQSDADVLILGGGTRSTGLYAAGLAKALGADRVDYVDRDSARLGIAASYGANPIEARVPPERLDPYQIVVDASATAAGLRCALRSTAVGGHCTTTGIYFEEQPLPLFDMYQSCVTYHTGPCQARPLIPAVLELIADGLFDAQPVTSEVVDWEDAPSAYTQLTTKTVIVRDAVHAPPA